MNRYHLIDTTTGEIIQERRTNPLLDGLRHTPRKKPAHKPSKRRRPRNDPMTHLVFFGGLLVVIAGVWLGNRVDVSFNW